MASARAERSSNEGAIVRPALSLEPILTCPNPRCGRAFRECDIQGVGFPLCKHCYQRWWAMMLLKGLVFPQIASRFEDEAIAAAVIEWYGMPLELTRHSFWQIALKPREVNAHLWSPPREMFGALDLLPEHRRTF